MEAEKEEGMGGRYEGSGKKMLGFFFLRDRCDSHYLDNLE